MIDPARLPEKPFKPSRRVIFLMGLAVAFAVAVGAAALAEVRDSSVRTERDIETRYALPVLASIPVLGAGAGARTAVVDRTELVLMVLTAAATLGLAVLLSMGA